MCVGFTDSTRLLGSIAIDPAGAKISYGVTVNMNFSNTNTNAALQLVQPTRIKLLPCRYHFAQVSDLCTLIDDHRLGIAF